MSRPPGHVKITCVFFVAHSLGSMANRARACLGGSSAAGVGLVRWLRLAVFVKVVKISTVIFNFVVAIVADIQEVRRIQSNVRVCDVLRRQPYFVMDDVAGRISAYLTQAAVNVDAGSDERRAALAPLF